MRFYTDEIRADSIAERLTLRAPEALDPGIESASLSVLSPGGDKRLIDSMAMDIDSQACLLSCDVDTSEGDRFPIARYYRAQVEIQSDGRTLRRVFYFDVLADPWRTNLSSADLVALAPLSAYEGDPADYTQVIAEAEEEIRVHLRARGVSPGLVRDKAALDRAHRLLALSLLHLRAAATGDSGHWLKMREYRTQYERVIGRLLGGPNLDENQNGAIDDPRRNHAIARLSP